MTTDILQAPPTGPAFEMTHLDNNKPSGVSDWPESIDGDRFEDELIDSRPLLEGSKGDLEELYHDETPGNKDYAVLFQKQQSSWRISSGFWILLTMLCVTTLVGVAVFFRLFQSQRHAPDNSIPVGPYWQGFSNITHYFAFGDSWTDTHFWPGGEQPSTTNPLGNPAFPGMTSSNGPNYVGYLAAQYNHSFIKAYGLAFSGSTIDATIDRPLLDWVDLDHQIRDQFLKYHTTNETGVAKPRGWKPETALFSTFFGINDVMVFDRSNPQWEKVFTTYETLIGKLYDASARNFLIINVPPIDRAPIITIRTPEEQAAFKRVVQLLNNNIRKMVQSLRRKYTDITIFEFDINDLMNRVTDNPGSTPQTSRYTDTTTFCVVYKDFETDTVPTAEQITTCGETLVEQYLWLNGLHITWPMHEAVAAAIERILLSANLT